MAQEDQVQIQDIASAAVAFDGTVRKARGCTIERTGVGEWTIDINPLNLAGPSLPAAESCSKVQIISDSNPQLTAQITHATDTQKLIQIRAANNALTDVDFSVTLARLLAT